MSSMQRRAFRVFVLFALIAAAPAAAYDVPTGAAPSPLFGAEPFTQQMLRFEEFGNRPMPATECENCSPLPATADCNVGPDPAELDDFIAQRIHPLPTREANDGDPNPWEPRIEECIRPMSQTVAEGRPPGEFFAHQRWDEFEPLEHYVTAQTGARTNTGFRDGLQNHGYRHTAQGLSEFGPFGLYHNTTGLPGFDGTTNGLEPKFHPNMPVQLPESLWTFDGCFPPRLLMARVGVPVRWVSVGPEREATFRYT